MNKNRRDFLKKATLGSIAITSAGSLSVFEAHSKTLVPEEIKTTNPLELTKPWEISFNEVKNELSLINGPVKIKGQINFYSEDKKWTISNSRDGVLNRYALIDTNGNVQGYFVLNPDFGQVQFLFYHRTAQAYEGELTFEGTINYLPDSFACRTKASVDERVLSMSCGNTDSILNDSLFSPEKDAVLQLNASNIHLKNLSPDSYSFYLKGYIHKSSEAIFSICFEEDYFKNHPFLLEPNLLI